MISFTSQTKVRFLMCMSVFVYSASDARPSESSAWSATSISCLLQLSFKRFNTLTVWSEHQNPSVCIGAVHCWVRDSIRIIRMAIVFEFLQIFIARSTFCCRSRFRLVPCAVLPYCCTGCQNCNHYCPSCGTFLGTYIS